MALLKPAGNTSQDGGMGDMKLEGLFESLQETAEAVNENAYDIRNQIQIQNRIGIEIQKRIVQVNVLYKGK